MSQKSPYVIRASEVEPYSPANHTGTKNYRLIGPNVNGAKYLEIALGDIERNEGSPAHAHPDLEQAVYILEGEAIAGIDGVDHHVKAGDMLFFPASGLSFHQGTDRAHQATGDLFPTLRRGPREAHQVEAPGVRPRAHMREPAGLLVGMAPARGERGNGWRNKATPKNKDVKSELTQVVSRHCEELLRRSNPGAAMPPFPVASA